MYRNILPERMPSSPKSFRVRQSIWRGRRSTVLILSFLIGFSCFICGLVLISRAGLGNGCFYGKPLSVIVAWDNSSAGGGTNTDGRVLGEGPKRHKAMGFVGVLTGLGSTGRRRALRQTWFPYDRQGLRRLEESTGLVFRFVIGRTGFKPKMRVLEKEISEYDDFLLLDIQEEYTNRPQKTLDFFKAAHALYECDFYVKVDDNIYLRPDRLSFLLAKDRSYSLTYIGCMKKGLVRDGQDLEWRDPLSYLLGKEYFLHARSPIYALSADAVENLVSLRNDSLRMFEDEDVTMGSWMLAMNVDHEHSDELCSKECTATSIAVWDVAKCSGLCGPEKKMLDLHKLEICSNSSTLPYEPPDDDDDDDDDDEDD